MGTVAVSGLVMYAQNSDFTTVVRQKLLKRARASHIHRCEIKSRLQQSKWGSIKPNLLCYILDKASIKNGTKSFIFSHSLGQPNER